VENIADVRRLKSPSSDTPSSQEEVRASSPRLLQIKETITLLRGDLDWIVMRCLEKDRTRRYETVGSRQWLAKFQEHLSWVSGLKFSQDGSRLISASADQTCVIHDRKAQTTRRLRGHTTEIWAMDISADGNSLVTGAGMEAR
jgi:WD40 repeat protein